jgi:hypothetical protein
MLINYLSLILYSLSLFVLLVCLNPELILKQSFIHFIGFTEEGNAQFYHDLIGLIICLLHVRKAGKHWGLYNVILKTNYVNCWITCLRYGQLIVTIPIKEQLDLISI